LSDRDKIARNFGSLFGFEDVSVLLVEGVSEMRSATVRRNSFAAKILFVTFTTVPFLCPTVVSVGYLTETSIEDGLIGFETLEIGVCGKVDSVDLFSSISSIRSARDCLDRGGIHFMIFNCLIQRVSRML
jgi:hypothetical protein